MIEIHRMYFRIARNLWINFFCLYLGLARAPLIWISNRKWDWPQSRRNRTENIGQKSGPNHVIQYTHRFRSEGTSGEPDCGKRVPKPKPAAQDAEGDGGWVEERISREVSEK